MATIKAYLYCAKAGEKLVRYSKELFEKKLDDTDEETYEMCCNELGLDPNKHYHVGKGFGEKNRLLVSGDEGYYMPFDKPLNGTVCFECDIEEAEKVLISPFPLANGDYQYGTKTLTPDALETWSCLSVGELNDYNPRYVLYLYNVKAIKPKPITDFFGYNGKDLRYGYQNMGRIVDRETNICHLCISIKPECLCKILNGEKTIDVRRVITKELKELING